MMTSEPLDRYMAEIDEKDPEYQEYIEKLENETDDEPEVYPF